jgi:hypothetical protein
LIGVSVLMTEILLAILWATFIMTLLRFTLMFPVIILHFGIFSNGYQAASTK